LFVLGGLILEKELIRRYFEEFGTGILMSKSDTFNKNIAMLPGFPSCENSI